MRIAVMLTPLTDHNLRLAAQVGASEIVAPYPGPAPGALHALRDRIAAQGLRLGVIERLIPHLDIVHGLERRDEQVAGFKQLIRDMGDAGVPVLCYNWMPDDDWQRTQLDLAERGGALVTGFDLHAPTSQVPTHTGYEAPIHRGHVTSAADLWQHLADFLGEIVPVAEEAGVKLAIHPDDPPLAELRGQPRIIVDPDSLLKVTQLVPSPANGICFCQGTMATRGDVDLPAAIADLTPHIHFVHFRDVVGTPTAFRESFIDNGQTDMAACMRAYQAAGLDEVPIRPDHVPTLAGETSEHPGYQTLGRLHAIGYMRGLMDATMPTVDSPAADAVIVSVG